MISAANICLRRNAPQSKSLKTFSEAPRTIVCPLGSNELLCSIQQVNKWVIAPGLLAHHSRKAGAPASKMHMTPQGSNIPFRERFCHASAAWVLASAVRCAMAGTSTELRRSIRGMFSAHPIMILNMHKRFSGASPKGLSILTSARPSAVLPRLQFQLPRRYCSKRFWLI